MYSIVAAIRKNRFESHRFAESIRESASPAKTLRANRFESKNREHGADSVETNRKMRLPIAIEIKGTSESRARGGHASPVDLQ